MRFQCGFYAPMIAPLVRFLCALDAPSMRPECGHLRSRAPLLRFLCGLGAGGGDADIQLAKNKPNSSRQLETRIGAAIADRPAVATSGPAKLDCGRDATVNAGGWRSQPKAPPA